MDLTKEQENVLIWLDNIREASKVKVEEIFDRDYQYYDEFRKIIKNEINTKLKEVDLPRYILPFNADDLISDEDYWEYDWPERWNEIAKEKGLACGLDAWKLESTIYDIFIEQLNLFDISIKTYINNVRRK